MTSASELLGGFGLRSGSEIQLSTHVFKVKRAHTDAVVTKKEKESYEYPFQLTLLPSSSAASALSASTVQSLFAALVSAPKVIYNAYGSPYDCTIGKISCKSEEKKKKATKKKQKTGGDEKSAEEVEISFIVDATGAAQRNHELPTKSQSNAAATAVPIEIRKLYSGAGYEIRKSAFGNAKCAHCHGGVEVGEYIAKKTGEAKTTGGWMHFSCVRKENPLDEAGAVAAAEAKKNKPKGKKSDAMNVEKKTKKERASAPGAPPVAIRKLYTTDFDVRTSAFEGSFCAICDDQIEKGEWIAKAKNAEEAGGWAHFNCLRKKQTKDGDDLKDIPEEEDAEQMKSFIDDENEGDEQDEEKEWDEEEEEEEDDDDGEEEEEKSKKGKKEEETKKRKR